MSSYEPLDRPNAGYKPRPGRYVSGWRDDYSIEVGRLAPTPARLGQMLRAADMGDPEALFGFFTAVEEDPHVHRALRERKLNACNRTLSITAVIPEGATGHERAQQAADYANAAIFGEQTGERGIENIQDGLIDIADAIGRGVSLVQIAWELRDGVHRPRKLLHYPQRELVFGDPLQPLDRVSADSVRIRTADNVQGEPLAPNSWVLHTHKARSAPIPKAALLRTISFWYLFKRFSVQDWTIFCEKYGTPTRVGTYNRGAADKEVNALKDAVIALGKDGGVVIPDGTRIELLEPRISGKDVPQAELARFCNDEISKAINGSTMSAEAPERGARSLGEVHERGEHALADLDAARLAETLRWQLVAPVVRLGLGDGFPIPNVTLERRETVDQQALVDKHVKLKAMGLPMSKEWLYEVHEVRPPDLDNEDDVLGGGAPPTDEQGNPIQPDDNSPVAEDVDDETADDVAASIRVSHNWRFSRDEIRRLAAEGVAPFAHRVRQALASKKKSRAWASPSV